jgi:hypothetical protein
MTQTETLALCDEQTLEFSLASLRDLASAARRVDGAGFEDLSPDRFRRELVPVTIRLGELTTRVLSQLLERFDSSIGSEGEADPFADSPSNELVDTLFVARLQVQQATEEIRSQADLAEHWDLVTRCSRFRGLLCSAIAAVGRSLRSTAVIESAAGEARIDLNQSLLIRRTYMSFLRVVAPEHEPAPEQVVARLTSIASWIRQVLGSNLAKIIRVGDRCQLRHLQQKIESWFESAGQPGAVDGVHLWQDASAVATMLVQINNRHELIEHDRQLARQVLGSLVAADVAESRDPDLLERLSALRGRDRELDFAIDEVSEAIQRQLVPHLRALVARMG